MKEAVILLLIVEGNKVEMPLPRQLALNCLRQYNEYYAKEARDLRMLYIERKTVVPEEFMPQASVDLKRVSAVIIREIQVNDQG